MKKTIIYGIVLILLMGLVQAINVGHDINLDVTGAENTKRGFWISPNTDLDLDNITKSADANPSKAYIFHSNGSLLVDGTFTGDHLILSAGVYKLLNGKSYAVLAGYDDTTSYTTDVKDPWGSFPVSKAEFDWITGTRTDENNLVFSNESSASNIISLGVTNSTTGNFTIDGYDYFDNSSLINFTAEIYGVGNFSTESGLITTYMLNGNGTKYNIRVTSNQSGGYFNITYYDYNVSTNLDAYLHQSELNVTTIDLISGGYISGGTLSVPGQTVNNGNRLLLKAGTYTVTFTHANYPITTSSFTVSALENKSVNMNIGTVVNLTFINEITNQTITDVNISVSFISVNDSLNFTAENGQLNATLAYPSNYTIRYSATGYGRLRQYMFRLINSSDTDILLYMIEASNSTAITATVYDQATLNKFEGAVVYLQRYFIDSNSYNTVATYTSDVLGKTFFDVQADSELYKFVVESPWLTSRLVTEELYLSDTNYNLFLDFEDEIAENTFKKNEIIYSIAYSNASQTFTATYNDPERHASEYCFYLKKQGQYSKEILNSSCSTSNTGSIEISGLVNETYNYAVFTANINNEELPLGSASEILYEDNLGAGQLGFFMTAIIFMVLVLGSAVSIYALVVSSIAIVFAKTMGLIAISWAWVIGLLIVSTIASWFMASKK